MNRLRSRLTRPKLAAGALGGAGAALALALTLSHAAAQTTPTAIPSATATASPTTTATAPRQSLVESFLGDVAGKLHVSVDQLKAALSGAEKDAINARVASGQLTQDQANKLIARIDQNGPAVLPRMPGALRDRGTAAGAGLRGAGDHVVAVVASQTGLTPKQLKDELRAGKSLAQVGQEHGKTEQQLSAAITADVKQRLDQQVSSGKITTDQETTLLTRATKGLDKLLNRQSKKQS